jgi:alkane 1-monooxygenase
MGFLKYLLAFVLPALAFLGFEWGYFFSFSTFFFAFGIIPYFEWKCKPSHSNVQAEKVKSAIWFKLLLYLTLPAQLLLFHFYFSAQINPDTDAFSWFGNLTAMGIICGVFGINVAHELGHSPKLFDRLVARTLLGTSLYMHFYVEHNKGHHKWIGTIKDPATARKNESVYRFWLRVIPGSYFSAWKISRDECKRKNRSVLLNETLLYSLLQLALCIGIYLWNPIALFSFVLAALLGAMLLESVNYIEHYGLTRNRVNADRYEQVSPEHSWNSDHVLGRAVLFELSRHSDHHANPERSYQDLRSLDSSKQLPFGYPAMIILALFPTKWFKVMNSLLND